jgi:hypothetical protein
MPCSTPLSLLLSRLQVTKYQSGPATNSGPVAIASGMPAVMIDSPAIHEVLGPPKDDDIVVVDRDSKCGRTGLKVSTVWEYLTNDIKPNTLPFVSPALYERGVDWEVERARCYSLEFVCQFYCLACYATLGMRPLSISCAEGFVVISCRKVVMTNLAGETIDARCVGCVYIYIHIYV